MTQKILTLTVAAVMALFMLVPAGSLADSYDRYVYTENGGSLNVRSEPRVDDNIISTIPFGTGVYVDYDLGNGWTQIAWGGEYDFAYVQTRFLVRNKPGRRPSQPAADDDPGDNSSSIGELNRIFRTYRRVDNPFTVTVRPVRASGWVNVRFAPSKLAELLSTQRDGAQLLVIGELQDWYQVENPNTGEVGYISRKYVVR